MNNIDKRTIQISKSELDNLRLAHKKAEKDNIDKFIFQGRVILTSYAKYLIRYLEDKFK